MGAKTYPYGTPSMIGLGSDDILLMIQSSNWLANIIEIIVVPKARALVVLLYLKVRIKI